MGRQHEAKRQAMVHGMMQGRRDERRHDTTTRRHRAGHTRAGIASKTLPTPPFARITYRFKSSYFFKVKTATFNQFIAHILKA
jgi:hypothetical protein